MNLVYSKDSEKMRLNPSERDTDIEDTDRQNRPLRSWRQRAETLQSEGQMFVLIPKLRMLFTFSNAYKNEEEEELGEEREEEDKATATETLWTHKACALCGHVRQVCWSLTGPHRPRQGLRVLV